MDQVGLTILVKVSQTEQTLLGTAFPFAFALVEGLCGEQKRLEIVKPMVFSTGTSL